MKDESEGKIIGEFVGLKSKMHSMKNVDDKESNTAKGVNIATAFNEFKDTFFNRKIIRHKMRKIQGKKHKMGTYKINKMSLSCFADKRLVSNNGIHTLAYFHKDLKKQILTDDHKQEGFKKILTNGYKQKQMHINGASTGELIGILVISIVK